MAIQLWQQILLSEPDNTDALAGLAKDYKLNGSTDLAMQALDRLRKINPRDPDIAQIESMASTAAENDELRQAGELARQGRNEDAMRIYRQLYGDHPPPGDIALAYYQTLYATASGKSAAIDALRVLAAKNPADSRYAITLGTLLTYDAHTRDEGIRILEAHPHDASAQSALRQALVWNAANPESATDLRQYLQAHPGDSELAADLSQDEKKLAEMNSGIARNPAERAAFAALNAHQLDEADKRFSDLLESEPGNGRVQAGMGFLRMQQKNFADAINYLSLAEKSGYKPQSVDDALAASRFYLALGAATEAFNANHLDIAQSKFRAALDMNPPNPSAHVDALNGLAGVYVRQQQYLAAAGIYEELVRADPASVDGWRGLFLADARSGQNDRALAVSARFPSAVSAALNKDPDYLHTLAAIYQSEHRDADAERVLTFALALPFPGDGSALEAGTKMQYAGILMEARRYPQAIALYAQLVAADPANLSAWMGLVAARHELGQDAQAVADVEKIPPPTYEAALKDPNFLALLGAIYRQAGQLDVAQGMSERAEKLVTSSGAQPSASLDLQLAGIDLQRNAPDQAIEIYRRIIAAHPGNADAWKGAVASLAAANRTDAALQQIDQIPVDVRKQLDSDIGFIETEATLYASTGDTAQATQSMNRILAYFAKLKQPPPPVIDIQNALLLYSIGNDRALYPALMRIGGRTDLTSAQRESVQEIWAEWSVRRAAEAFANGNVSHALDILDAASLAFPNNLNVRRAVAGGYEQVGRAKEAFALYKSVPMQDASPADFEGAVDAALAQNDKAQAEAWVHQALDRFPRDPIVLSLAARFEQARGDNERAAEYYRESLAAMPPASPTDRLAHALVYPEQDSRAHRPVTAADLQRLLDPDNEPLPKTARIPPLLPYGPDPYQSPAPVATPEPQLPVQPPPSAQPHPAVNFVPQSFHTLRPSQNNRVCHPRGAFVFAARVGYRQSYPRIVILSELRTAKRVEGPAFSFFNEKNHSFHDDERTLHHIPRLILVSLRPTRVLRPVLQAPTAPDVPDIILDPPHSLASDAWKGLVFSLIASNRNAEALMQLSRIPPDVRRQLEQDIEWVQGIASLYVAVDDMPHAGFYLQRVANFYLLHRMQLPAAVEIQHAGLLSNAHDDAALYPVMQRLDARTDLTAADREQVDALWVSMAIRRATADLDSGQPQRAIEILQAAAQDYPDSMLIRRSMAGALVRVGRAQDAFELYKTIPMDAATPGDYEGAISAALATGDKAQSETWLRAALARYPDDPQVLALAARFEQARGNTQRAAEFWRAALAAMPPGSDAKSLGSAPALFTGSNPAPAPGRTKRLLDPHLSSEPTPERLAPLPSYKTNFYSSPQSGPPSDAHPSFDLSEPTQSSGNPLPFPSTAEQGTESSPVLVEKSATAPVMIPPAAAAPTASYAAPDIYTGTAGSSANSAAWEVPETSSAPSTAALASAPQSTMPVASQPMYMRYRPPPPAHSPELTRAPDQIAQSLPTAPVAQMPAASHALPADVASNSPQTNSTQTGPLVQDAVTGAFSAPQSSSPLSTPGSSSKSLPAHPRRKPAAPVSTQSAAESASPSPATPEQTLGNAPIGDASDLSRSDQSPQTGSGATGDELAQGNLSPLRGVWSRIFRQTNPPSPREQVEEQLRAIEGGYSGWLGGTSTINYRAGTPGYDQLAAIETPFEAAAPLGANARIVAVAKPVFLDSGAAQGSATLAVLESSASGTSLLTIPEPVGTLTTTSTTPPAQQNAAGLGGELQLIFPHLAFAGGSTPSNFLVSNFTGRLQWRPANGPLTFSALRDSVNDSQLSYAGLRDPAGSTVTSPGQIWGGVVADQAQVQFNQGNVQSGLFAFAGGQYITGKNTLSNTRIDGGAGAYWHVFAAPEYGDLTVCANFFAMHYANNENAFTFGIGGYFSPQTYILADVPFNWTGHWQTRWHYTVTGALGLRAFQQDSARLWPLAAQKALEASQGNPMLPAVTSVGPSYDLKSEAAYQISPHMFAGFNVAANNARDYNFSSFGFFIRFTFREQPSAVAAPTGLFPTVGLRPFTVP
jgi:tetratricopeptide (TPR) repeat protein